MHYSLVLNSEKYSSDLTADHLTLTIRLGKCTFLTIYIHILCRNVSDEDGGLYSCQLSNVMGIGRSDGATLMSILSPPHVSIRMSPEYPVMETSKASCFHETLVHGAILEILPHPVVIQYNHILFKGLGLSNEYC